MHAAIVTGCVWEWWSVGIIYLAHPLAKWSIVQPIVLALSINLPKWIRSARERAKIFSPLLLPLSGKDPFLTPRTHTLTLLSGGPLIIIAKTVSLASLNFFPTRQGAKCKRQTRWFIVLLCGCFVLSASLRGRFVCVQRSACIFICSRALRQMSSSAHTRACIFGHRNTQWHL